MGWGPPECPAARNWDSNTVLVDPAKFYAGIQGFAYAEIRFSIQSFPNPGKRAMTARSVTELIISSGVMPAQAGTQ
jgi:hypothetical protein